MTNNKAQFSKITLIYNPNSTGGAPEKAEELKLNLQKRLKGVEIESVTTERAGHAEEMTMAVNDPGALVVSVSGDGGYNEVINGAMQKPADKRPIVAVFPAGNANDHRRATKRRNLTDSIVANDIHTMDVLRVTINQGKAVRYAHSYIGLGITPVAAVELNRHTLNAFKEAMVVFKTFREYQPFKIEREGKIYAFNSLVFANINQMAKVVTLSEEGTPDDGKFEVIALPVMPKWKIILVGLKATVSALKPDASVKKYDFVVVKDMPMQLDGEVTELKTGDNVLIEVMPRAVRVVA